VNALILLSAISAWEYDGFVSDPGDSVNPSPAGAAAPEIPAIPPPAVSPEAPKAHVAPAARPREEAAARPTPPAAAANRAATPALWRLADASGQVWEHTDPAWLKTWVQSRNGELQRASAPVYSPMQSVFAPAGCPGGRCYGRR
jgi:hypothetical protein